MISKLIHGCKVTGWMTNVLYVPKLSSNLFSVHSAALRGNVVSFGRQNCWIRKKRRKLIRTGTGARKAIQTKL